METADSPIDICHAVLGVAAFVPKQDAASPDVTGWPSPNKPPFSAG